MILVSACLAGLRTRYDGNGELVKEVLRLIDEGKAVLVCPEQLGGLPTPRLPAEIAGGTGEAIWEGKAKVVDAGGRDVTDAFMKGAEETLRIAQLYRCKAAVLKESSPSCGSAAQYDGTFSHRKVPGIGVTSALLKQNGIALFSEKDLVAGRIDLSPFLDETGGEKEDGDKKQKKGE